MRTRKKRNRFLVSFLLAFFFIVAFSFSAHAEQTPENGAESLKENFIKLMNRWASFRWGLSCLVYVLYYDPSILKPWVELNAKLNNWDESEKRSFEESVKSALKIGEATAFLITIENIGKKPFSIAPVSKNLVLMDSKGKKFYPVKFEPQLESQISGKVQGLVFFPKLSEKKGRITLKIKGLPDGEALFSWNISAKEEELAERNKKVISWEELSKGAPKEKERKSKTNNRKEKQVTKVVKPKAQIKTVVKPTPPKPPPKPVIKTEVKPPSHKKKIKNVEKIPVKLLPLKNLKEKGVISLKRQVERVKVLDPQKVLKDYISAWQRGDYKKMYSLLSSESRKKLSFLKFKKVVEEGPPRWIKEGKYRILPPKKVNGETRITLIASVKFGFIKIVQTKSFYFVLDKEGWRIRF